MPTPTKEQPRNIYTLAIIAIVMFLVLILKNSGLYPFIFSDEYTYSLYSRHLPLSDSMIPGYLYLAIYRLTNHCAADFLGCARLLNAFFFISATPFIYAVARRVTSVAPALLITICALAAPINAYTANYMPEALYFLGFWVFIWSVSIVKVHTWRSWAFAGFILGCTALIKPHSMFFVPAVILYMAYVSFASKEGGARLVVRNIASFLVAGLFAKFFISFLIAGPAGLTFFGPSYNKIASTTTSSLDHVISLILLALESIKGHLLALCLIIGLPVMVVLHTVFKSVGSRAEPDDSQKMAILATLLMANLVAVIGLFTASVVNTSVFESVTRLHMRYYDFVFPLLWIIVASRLSAFPSVEARKWRLCLAVVIGLPLIYASYTAMAPYEPSIIDSPELRGFLFNPVTFRLLSALSLLSVAVWVWSSQRGVQFFVYVTLPLTVLLSSYWVTKEQRLHLIPDVYDRAGTFAREYLPADERTKVIIMGSDMGGLTRAAFYLDNLGVSAFPVSDDNHYDFVGLPEDKQWALSIGAYIPPAAGRTQVVLPGFALTRISANETVDFRGPRGPEHIHALGLSGPEDWGTWSKANTVRLQFPRPLPATFSIRLVAKAFGPNVGKDFVLHAGATSTRFVLTEHTQEQSFEIDNPGGASIIRIDVPEATSPATVGMSNDGRMLGIGLEKLSIEVPTPSH